LLTHITDTDDEDIGNYIYISGCWFRVEPANEYYDGERDNDRDDAVDV